MSFSIGIDIVTGGKAAPSTVWTARDSRSVGAVIVSLINRKTLEGKDALYRKFKPYASPRSAKGRTHVDLYDTGAMLNSLRVVKPTRKGFDVAITSPSASRYAPTVNATREFMGWAPKDNARINKRIDSLIDKHLKMMRAAPALGGV